MFRSKNRFLEYICLTLDDYSHIVKKLNKYYYTREIPKLTKRNKYKYSNGKIENRKIKPSKFKLKDIQLKIKNLLKKDINFPMYYMGGIKGKDNLKNAQYHQGNHYFFSTDLRKFFPSITANMIYRSLVNAGYSADVSRIITRLCSIDNELPQGIHPATILANMVTLNMTKELEEFCAFNSIKFSIYVDDLDFSSKTDFKNKAYDIIKIINKHGFKINHRKTYYKLGKSLITGCNARQNKITPASYVYYNYKQETNISKKTAIKHYINRFNS